LSRVTNRYLGCSRKETSEFVRGSYKKRKFLLGQEQRYSNGNGGGAFVSDTIIDRKKEGERALGADNWTEHQTERETRSRAVWMGLVLRGKLKRFTRKARAIEMRKKR